MKKKVLLLCIQIGLVLLALILTVATYAWYVSQTTVHTSQTTVMAAAGANTRIDREEDDPYTPYMGQTGQGYAGDGADAVDAPYTVTKRLTVSFSPNGDDSYLAASILTVNIDRMDGERLDSSSAAEMIGNFTFRILIDNVSYAPDENGFLYYLDDNDSPVYYPVPAAKQVEMTFELIYQSEESYRNWLAGDYDAVDSFAYCDYAYMRAVFTFTFQVGIEPRVAVTP